MKFYDALKMLEEKKCISIKRKHFNVYIKNKYELAEFFKNSCLDEILSSLNADWEIEEDEKFKWPEVIKGLKQGKTYRRIICHDDYCIHCKYDGSLVRGRIFFKRGGEAHFNVTDFEDDWIEIK